MNKAEREEAARKYVCPRCHAEAGHKCRTQNPARSRGYAAMPGRLMKGVHAERLREAER